MSLIAAVLSTVQKTFAFVNRLNTDYTTARAVEIDTINSNTQTAVQASATQTGLTNQGYTSTRAAYLDALANGSSIKSVQQGSGTVTITGGTPGYGNNSASVGISSVNTSKSIVLLNGISNLGPLNAQMSINGASARLASSTLVTITYSAYAVSGGQASATIHFTVIEFN